MRKWLILAALSGLAACSDGETAPDTTPQEAAIPAAGQRETPESALPAVPRGRDIQVLAFGDSLLAGYNLPRSEAYPAQLEAALRARGIDATVINAGVSGDTTAAGLQRLDFVLDGLERKPALAIVEFGGNDLLRGLSPSLARDNLDAMLARFAQEDIPVVIMGLEAPPSAGSEYRRQFNAIYPELAEKYDAALVPMFIAPLIEDRTLVQADQIHPTRNGVAAMVSSTIDTIASAAQKAAADE
ncbi:arylesterase [Croceicoccus sp. YJ47]|nr:arylesterase [Croceicoccus sp. YJ47]